MSHKRPPFISLHNQVPTLRWLAAGLGWLAAGLGWLAAGLGWLAAGLWAET